MEGQAQVAVDKADTSRTLRHFRLMKKNAVDINANCKAFWSCVAEVKVVGILQRRKKTKEKAKANNTIYQFKKKLLQILYALMLMIMYAKKRNYS